MMRLAPHFTWEEAELSPTAVARGIDNSVPTSLYTNLGRSAQLMEDIRALLGGRPLRVSSWYRCEALNKAIKGSPTSKHPDALAVDWKPYGMGLEEAFDIVAKSALPFDQLIIEGTTDGASWIHVGLAEGKPRREVLRARGDRLGGPMTFQRVRDTEN